MTKAFITFAVAALELPTPVLVGIIAAGAVVLRDVPPDCTAVGIPARIIYKAGSRPSQDLDQIHIPDPFAQEIMKLKDEISMLEKRLAELETGNRAE